MHSTEESTVDEYVRIPDDIIIDYSQEDAINNLISNNVSSAAYMSEHAILSTKNDHINAKQPSSPHELNLKINCLLMLLRNLDPDNGLCNGTCLVVGDNAIGSEIVGSAHACERLGLRDHESSTDTLNWEY
ncbi:hypothetical protein EJB05_12019, partial [Eragrostis curvula]